MAKQQKDTFYDSPVLENRILSPYKSFETDFSRDSEFRRSSVNTLQRLISLFLDSSQMPLPTPSPVPNTVFNRTNYHFARFENESTTAKNEVERYTLLFVYSTQIAPIFGGGCLNPETFKDLHAAIMHFNDTRIGANTMMKKGTKDVCTLEEKFSFLKKDSESISTRVSNEEKEAILKQAARYVFEFSNENYSRVAHILANGYISACLAVGIKGIAPTFDLYMNAHNAHKRNNDGVLFLPV